MGFPVSLDAWRARIALAVGVALLASVAPIAGATPVALAVTATTTTIDVPADTVYGETFATVPVTAHVRPVPVPTGGYTPAVNFLVDGAFNSPAPLDVNGDAQGFVHLAPGTYSVVASFGGIEEWAPSDSSPATVTVGVSTTMTLTSSLNPALDTQPVTITATVTPAAGALSGGTVTIVDGFDGSTVASGTVGDATSSVSVTRTFATGSHALTATYTGHGDFGPSDATLTHVSSADTAVSVTGLGIQYATFYPVVDSFKDTVAIKGRLGEPASVLIRIYSPAGKLVRTADLGARAPGAYAWTWNGRNAAGTLLAAGKYKIVQRVTDTAANVKSATFYVTLSRQHLHWSTHTITLFGSQFGISGKAGTGSVSKAKSAYDHGVRISSGCSWAAVRYTFSLRAATVYRPLTFKVLGKSPNKTGAWEGLWNKTYGSALYTHNYDVEWIGPGYGWYAISGDPTTHRKGRTTYGEVVVQNESGVKNFDIAKVRLTYRYAVLHS